MCRKLPSRHTPIVSPPVTRSTFTYPSIQALATPQSGPPRIARGNHLPVPRSASVVDVQGTHAAVYGGIKVAEPPRSVGAGGEPEERRAPWLAAIFTRPAVHRNGPTMATSARPASSATSRRTTCSGLSSGRTLPPEPGCRLRARRHDRRQRASRGPVTEDVGGDAEPLDQTSLQHPKRRSRRAFARAEDLTPRTHGPAGQSLRCLLVRAAGKGRANRV